MNLVLDDVCIYLTPIIVNIILSLTTGLTSTYVAFRTNANSITKALAMSVPNRFSLRSELFNIFKIENRILHMILGPYHLQPPDIREHLAFF